VVASRIVCCASMRSFHPSGYGVTKRGSYKLKAAGYEDQNETRRGRIQDNLPSRWLSSLDRRSNTTIVS
jgi:hypothetical protein